MREITFGSRHFRSLQFNRETHEHSKLQRHRCHKRGIKYHKGSENIKGLPIRMTSESFWRRWNMNGPLENGYILVEPKEGATKASCLLPEETSWEMLSSIWDCDSHLAEDRVLLSLIHKVINTSHKTNKLMKDIQDTHLTRTWAIRLRTGIICASNISL